MDDLSYIQTHFDPLYMDEISDEQDLASILSWQKEEISGDNNTKEFLQHYQRKFQSDELDFTNCNSCSNQQGNASILFTQYSLSYDQICSCCNSVSSILRNFSFISRNDLELTEDRTLTHLFTRLLLFTHDFNHFLSDKKSFSWSECLINIRENTLVTLANISTVFIFDQFDFISINQLIDGILHLVNMLFRWSTNFQSTFIHWNFN
jgi:hypothetical protein